MKTSKFIHIIYIINKIWFAITLCLFTTIILGFIAEIVLGYVQVLSSLLIIIKWKTFTKSVQYKLKVYWMITGLYLVLWLFDWNFLNDTFLYTIGVGIIPMCIALHFLNILRIIKKGVPFPLMPTSKLNENKNLKRGIRQVEDNTYSK